MKDASVNSETRVTWTIVASGDERLDERWTRACRRLIPDLDSACGGVRLIESFDGRSAARPSRSLPVADSLFLWPADASQLVAIAQSLVAWPDAGRDGLHILAAKSLPLSGVVALQSLGIHWWVRHPEQLAARMPAVARYFRRLRQP